MSSLPIMTSPPGPEIHVDGVRYLYFGGSSYLGLAAHPEVIEAGCRAMRQFGVHSATTRAGFGTNSPVVAVESRAAEFFGTEDAFYFGSGYVAPQIMAGALARGAETVIVDESAHYSAQDAARLAGLPIARFRARDPEDLGRAVRGHRRVLVVVDAVGPASGQVAPILEYVRVLEGVEEATLLADDAHGFGVLGPKGRGLLDELGLWPEVNRVKRTSGLRLAVCGTLSKAFGGFGGIIPGTIEFVTRTRVGSHHFDGASAPPSGAAGSTARALEIAAQEPFRREQVRGHSLRLRTGLKAMGLEVPEGATAHFGLSIGDAANMRRIHERLKARGILVPYIAAYSGISPEGVLRFAVFADHTTAQIDHLLAELQCIL